MIFIIYYNFKIVIIPNNFYLDLCKASGFTQKDLEKYNKQKSIYNKQNLLLLIRISKNWGTLICWPLRKTLKKIRPRIGIIRNQSKSILIVSITRKRLSMNQEQGVAKSIRSNKNNNKMSFMNIEKTIKISQQRS